MTTKTIVLERNTGVETEEKLLALMEQSQVSEQEAEMLWLWLQETDFGVDPARAWVGELAAKILRQHGGALKSKIRETGATSADWMLYFCLIILLDEKSTKEYQEALARAKESRFETIRAFAEEMIWSGESEPEDVNGADESQAPSTDTTAKPKIPPVCQVPLGILAGFAVLLLLAMLVPLTLLGAQNIILFVGYLLTIATVVLVIGCHFQARREADVPPALQKLADDNAPIRHQWYALALWSSIMFVVTALAVLSLQRSRDLAVSENKLSAKQTEILTVRDKNEELKNKLDDNPSLLLAKQKQDKAVTNLTSKLKVEEQAHAKTTSDLNDAVDGIIQMRLLMKAEQKARAEIEDRLNKLVERLKKAKGKQ